SPAPHDFPIKKSGGDLRMNASRFLSAAAVVLLLAGSWSVFAKAPIFDTTGTIVGTVTDADGAALPGATIVIRNVGTNLTREVMTDEFGMFNAPLLPVGEYEVTAKVPDFNPGQNRVVLQINQVLRVYFQLTIAATVGEIVEVQGTNSILAVDNSTQSTVIENKKIVDLPLNGRNFLQLGMLIPGVT